MTSSPTLSPAPPDATPAYDGGDGDRFTPTLHGWWYNYRGMPDSLILTCTPAQYVRIADLTRPHEYGNPQVYTDFNRTLYVIGFRSERDIARKIVARLRAEVSDMPAIGTRTRAWMAAEGGAA